MDRTVYASETPQHPVVIVDSRKGKQFAPDDAATVLAFEERTGLPMVDEWLAINNDALRAYCNGDYDSVDFYAAMRTVKLEPLDP